MTDEVIINDTIRYINRIVEPPTIFANVENTIWWNFNKAKREHLRRLLLKSGYVNQNMENKWEFRLTADGDLALGAIDKVLELLLMEYLMKQPNIEFFMKQYFLKPNPRLESTTHETDNGVKFLEYLKGEGYIDYDKDDILHISNDWYIDDPATEKRWFDTVDKNKPFLVHLTEFGKNYFLFKYSLLKSDAQTNAVKTQATRANHAGTGWLKKSLIWIANNVILAILIGVVIFILGSILWYFIFHWLVHSYPEYNKNSN